MVAFLTCIQEGPNSNLSQGSAHPDWGLLLFSSASPDEWPYLPQLFQGCWTRLSCHNLTWNDSCSWYRIVKWSICNLFLHFYLFCDLFSSCFRHTSWFPFHIFSRSIASAVLFPLSVCSCISHVLTYSINVVDNWIVDTDQSRRIHREFCLRLSL